MSSVAADLRYALRGLRMRPRFTAVAVLTLALGIGAATVVASTVWGVLVRPLPLRDPGSLVFLWHRTATGIVPVAAPDAALYHERVSAFDGLAFGDRVTDAMMTVGAAPPAHLRVHAVSAGFFDVLGVSVALGRSFVPDEGLVAAGSDPDTLTNLPTALVLSDLAWRRHFGADSSVIGRLVRLNGQAATVVGVLAPDFVLPLPTAAGAAGTAEAWMAMRLPLTAFRRANREQDQDSDNTGVVIARLRAGVSLRTASAEAAVAASALRAIEPRYEDAGVRAELEPVAQAAVARARPVLAALAVAVALALVTAVANLGGLFLTVAASRRREVALRLALGATPARVARVLVAESLVVGVAGGTLGVVVAAWGLSAVRAVDTLGPLLQRADLNVAGVVSGVGLSVVLGLLLGGGAVLLAFRTRGHSLLRAGRSGSPIPGSSRRRLVALQVAVTVPLLVAAGLLFRTSRALEAVPLGYRADNAFVMDVALRDPERHRSPAARTQAVVALESELDGVPDVEAVGTISRAPLSGRRWANWYARSGAADRGTQRADFRMVTPGYFDAAGTRLLAGRTFTTDENRIERRRVAIVDRTLALSLGGPAAALGQRIDFPLDGAVVSAEIVGVVEPVHFESIRDRRLPALYVPYRHEASRDLSMLVRWSGPSDAVGTAVQAAAARVDPGLVPFNLRWLSQDVARSEGPTRTALTVISGFALLAAALAVMGLVAAVGLQVAARAREFAVHVAVGAAPRDLIRLAGAEGVRVLVVGLAVGAALAVLAGRLVRGLLFSVSPVDPLTIAIAIAATAALGTVAVLVPARGATRVEPVEMLRHE